MIRHVVLLRFRPEMPAALKRELFAELARLPDHLPGVAGFHAGPNDSIEPEVRHGFGDAFWFDFKDTAARQEYLDDPDHKAVGAKLVDNCVGGRDGIVVFDMTL